MTSFRKKNTTSSVYLNLEKSSYNGVIECSIFGKMCNDENCITNCTYKAKRFLLESGKKYEIFNYVVENEFEEAAICFVLNEGQIIEGLWSPDYIREPNVVAVGGTTCANTSDTGFEFNEIHVNQKVSVETRTKTNSSSCYLRVDELNQPIKLRIMGVGGQNGTRNETNKCDYYMINSPGKYELYNTVHENSHDGAFLEFEGNSNSPTRIKGVWSPDYIRDPDCIVIGGSSTMNSEYSSRLQPISNAIKFINVPYISQQGIPTGCESVSSTMVLQYFGIDIQPYDFITRYLPRMPFQSRPDPNCVFVGNPYSKNAFGCFAPCICSTIRRIISGKENFSVQNTTGESIDNLISKYINNDIPVIIWSTMGMLPTKYGSTTWTIKYINEDAKYRIGDTFKWPGNEHCLVLVGYTEDSYIFNDPLAGVGCYPKSLFETRFNEQGCQSVVLLNTNNHSTYHAANPSNQPIKGFYPQPPPKFYFPSIAPSKPPQSDEKAKNDAWIRFLKVAGGAWKITTGIATTSTSAAAITATGGIGTIVCGGSAVFGISNTIEGISDIILAFSENPDEQGFNPIRDFLYNGNQALYDLTDITLSLGVSSVEKLGKKAVDSAAKEAAQETSRIVAKEVTKDVSKDVSKEVTKEVTKEVSKATGTGTKSLTKLAESELAKVASGKIPLQQFCKTQPVFLPPEVTNSLSKGQSSWWIYKDGMMFNGRKYSGHALERMAPDCEIVKKVLQERYDEICQACKASGKTFKDWKSYYQPRGISPNVVEDIIKNSKPLDNYELVNGTLVKSADKIRHAVKYKGKGRTKGIAVILDKVTGDVVTIYKGDLVHTFQTNCHPNLDISSLEVFDIPFLKNLK
ncbi:hypothetical protein TRFO_40258 [Tritrichomonas foetus]|uniref:Peptidase C39-like domain-containing protein n=1 Tax=Tritrichomonas foetus TaxID=1144522 RepID=A0A1J4J7S7_9EUKA|nr:hypothetical protein TRFO_40258 [Tritrichomonas foetus]|eukprot:OHS93469.1 hypothetical protein TRFO_40258 [Tritrichomonas foetus]